jgi:hypothetical protein
MPSHTPQAAAAAAASSSSDDANATLLAREKEERNKERIEVRSAVVQCNVFFDLFVVFRFVFVGVVVGKKEGGAKQRAD